MDLIVPFHLKFARSYTSSYIYMGQRREISGSSDTENILINISPDKNTIALYVHDTEGNLLYVNVSLLSGPLSFLSERFLSET